MHFCLLVSLCLSLIFIQAPMTAAKICYYCDTIEVGYCTGIPEVCGEEQECYTGLGLAPLFPGITKKGCVAPNLCGKEQSVTYMGIHYTLTIYCCEGELCNGESAVTPQIQSNSANTDPMTTPANNTIGTSTTAAITVAAVVVITGLLMALFICYML
ncbi:sperm acrosome membrane-associated protein 4-like [Sminthopsis crassicaudata]|uniref:sperm acrosome membrane-associated protein 4-like n=1 Tax=Sminthopsis crassicaudata TaxID=9301 RepID=UPI003D6947A9